MVDLPVDVQGSVQRTIPARDLPDAQAKVQALRTQAIRCQLMAASGTPCGTNPATTPATPTPTPLVTTPTPGSTTPLAPGTGIPGTLPSPSATGGSVTPRLTTPVTPPPAAAGADRPLLEGVRA
jgi:PPM family protein phosphatase